MKTKLRFAPSPTGYIHMGNLRTAVINWLFAKKNHGDFIIRFDDTDKKRSKEHFVRQILDDFANLKLKIDKIHYQSARLSRYDEVFEILCKQKRIYPCYETIEDLQMFRRGQKLKNQPPIYKQQFFQNEKNQNIKPYYRFRLSLKDRVWQDLIRGEQKIMLKSISDPVVKRNDGSYLYTFTSALDDVDFAITHVIRGEDHVTNTAVQIDIIKTLTDFVPNFAHHNLLLDETGVGFSKRDASLSVKKLLEDGYEALTLLNYVVSIGSSSVPRPDEGIDEMLNNFDIKNYSRAPARTDINHLRSLNARRIQLLDDQEVTTRMIERGYDKKIASKYWKVLKANCVVFNDIPILLKLIEGPIKPQIDNADYCRVAMENLPPVPWNQDSFKFWAKTLAQKTGFKGKELFMPLRLALTGEKSGPELANIFPLIGVERVIKRLKGQVA